MFAILFAVLLVEIQEEIHHFAGWEGRGLRGAKIVNKKKGNKLAFPKLELHGRCRCCVLLPPCFGALFVADLSVGMEDLELHYRCRGRFNFQ